MPTLLACLSTGKGTWSEVLKLCRAQPWDKIVLITTPFGKENLTPLPNTLLIVVDFNKDLIGLIADLKKELKNITDFDIALNLIYGSGKEHMAVLEAVLELGFNFRLVTLGRNEVMETLGLQR